MSNIIELNAKKAKAGRVPIKLVLHKIHDDPLEFNSNGIHWNREYCELNKESVKGMPIVCQFADETNSIPFGGHGDVTRDSEGNISFENSLVVGSFEDSYIGDVEINGSKINGLIGQGYIYSQRFPCLVDYLQEQYNSGNTVESSVEICGDKEKGNTSIIYDGGWKEKGRIPKEFQYSGQALCIGVEAADSAAILLELNTKKKEGTNMPSPKDTTIEISELSYDDIARLICHAFNKAMNDNNWYYMYGLYPTSSRVVMCKDAEIPHYYITNYSIQNNTITLGEITEVEPDWKPVNNEKGVEFNSEIVNKQTKENEKNMDETKVIELNQLITDLTTKKTEIEATNVELSSAIVTANKTVEELSAKITTLETEINTITAERDVLKSEKATAENEQKKVEVNSYFTTEIPKNGFSDEEVNSLSHFIDEIDLAGLKSAETELCAKKFKEMLSKKEAEVETNSKEITFISIHEKEKKVISNENPTFFN